MAERTPEATGATSCWPLPEPAAAGLPMAREVVEAAVGRSVTVATAESLTAGLVSAALADIAGSSAVLRGGVVAYHNDVKSGLLGVDPDLLERVGSVDGEVAARMAVGARSACGADFAVSTTGVAGPAAHDGKDVGTVFIGYAGPDGTGFEAFRFEGDRQRIRVQSRDAALRKLRELAFGKD
ncbi:CinA family protein [Arthrobacter sp. KK5.5]|uniref:CinA family protein n=1 Tax=Arthrobacter sp. KK5.5 TaxID=3373084 RepID=UPI003EE77AD9